MRKRGLKWLGRGLLAAGVALWAGHARAQPEAWFGTWVATDVPWADHAPLVLRIDATRLGRRVGARGAEEVFAWSAELPDDTLPMADRQFAPGLYVGFAAPPVSRDELLAFLEGGLDRAARAGGMDEALRRHAAALLRRVRALGAGSHRRLRLVCIDTRLQDTCRFANEERYFLLDTNAILDVSLHLDSPLSSDIIVLHRTK
jgi:hypothetical protein